MKIVFLSPAAHGGGAEAALLDLLCALRAARPGWTLHLLAAEDGPLLARAAAEAGATTETLPFPAAVRGLGDNRRRAESVAPAVPAQPVVPQPVVSRWSRLPAALRGAAAAWGYARRLRARLRLLRPDVIHSNGMKMHLLGALACPAGVPLVWHLHDYLGARPAMRKLLRSLAGRCRLVVANSESVAADARAVLPPGLPVVAVHNAIDPAKFTPAGPALDLDALAGLPPAAPGTVRVGLLATFAFWKGHEVFLQAAARLVATPTLLPPEAAAPASAPGPDPTASAASPRRGAPALPPLRFYVVGGPLYAAPGSQRSREELQALAARLGLPGDAVGFTGFVDDAPAALRALDIVVHASTEPEPFGLVIAQALACARAVVAAAAGGARELIEPGATALTHPPGDDAALAEAIRRLAADPASRARLGAAGRVAVEGRFTRRHLAAALAPRYESLPKIS